MKKKQTLTEITKDFNLCACDALTLASIPAAKLYTSDEIKSIVSSYKDAHEANKLSENDEIQYAEGFAKIMICELGALSVFGLISAEASNYSTEYSQKGAPILSVLSKNKFTARPL